MMMMRQQQTKYNNNNTIHIFFRDNHQPPRVPYVGVGGVAPPDAVSNDIERQRGDRERETTVQHTL